MDTTEGRLSRDQTNGRELGDLVADQDIEIGSVLCSLQVGRSRAATGTTSNRRLGPPKTNHVTSSHILVERELFREFLGSGHNTTVNSRETVPRKGLGQHPGGTVK